MLNPDTFIALVAMLGMVSVYAFLSCRENRRLRDQTFKLELENKRLKRELQR